MSISVQKPGVLKNPGFVQCGENQGFVDIGLIVDLEKDKSIKKQHVTLSMDVNRYCLNDVIVLHARGTRGVPGGGEHEIYTVIYTHGACFGRAAWTPRGIDS